MKTYDLRNDQGQVFGFSVSNLLRGRHGVPRIVATIAGATVVRKQKRFAFTAPDDFCEFVVDGRTFLAIEPFGDNSEFWIVTEPPEECPQMETVRRAFEAYRPFWRKHDSGSPNGGAKKPPGKSGVAEGPPSEMLNRDEYV